MIYNNNIEFSNSSFVFTFLQNTIVLVWAKQLYCSYSRYPNEFGHTSIRSASLRVWPRDICDTCAFCSSSPNATKYADKLYKSKYKLSRNCSIPDCRSFRSEHQTTDRNSSVFINLEAYASYQPRSSTWPLDNWRSLGCEPREEGNINRVSWVYYYNPTTFYCCSYSNCVL